MSSKYDIPYHKRRANHGGGLLMYLSYGLAHTRIIDLETFWNESLWVEIKVNRESYLIGFFTVHKQQMLSSLMPLTKI